MRKILCYFTLPLLLLVGDSSGKEKNPEGQTGTLERMIVASGNVAIDLDLNRLNGSDFATERSETGNFSVSK